MTVEPPVTVAPFLVDVRNASALLGDLDLDCVRDLVRRGELDAITIATGGRSEGRKLRIVVASIEAYIERRLAEQCDEADGETAS